MARHNDVGKLGEDIACEYLESKGWKVVERNFRRPYGEIDIVARLPGQGQTNGLLVFVEVKTVSWETKRGDPLVAHGTHRPEDNMHPWKLKKLGNTIQSYLSFRRHYDDWRFDVLAVFLDPVAKTARVRHTEDVVIGT